MEDKSVVGLRSQAAKCRRAGDRIGCLQRLDAIIGLDAAQYRDWQIVGEVLGEIGEYAQAIGALEKSLELKPENVDAEYELGRSLNSLGDVDRAVDLLQAVATSTSHYPSLRSLATICVNAPKMNNSEVLKVRKHFAEMTRQDEAGLRSSVPNSRQNVSRRAKRTQRPLRIGYISAHWCDANYMKPVWPLINAHDYKKYDITLFDDKANANQTWSWLHGEPRIVPIGSCSNAEAADCIDAEQVDVLIDLSAYSKPTRLGLFTHRPAPIQIAWFNSFATSGFDEFDFMVGDRFTIDAAERRHYCEELLTLPTSYLSFQTNHEAPPVYQRSTINDDGFVFGCLGTQYKITPIVLDAWAKILCQATSSHLLIGNREMKSECNRQYLLDRFAERGVGRERVSFLPPASHFEFLKHYDRIDLTLDTFPYNGGTTTMESLWLGVPVLCFNGDRWASRTSRSIVGFSHLSEFAVADLDQYIQTAVAYATNPSKQASLREIRSTMRDRLSASKVCDTRFMVEKMEQLLERAVRSKQS